MRQDHLYESALDLFTEESRTRLSRVLGEDRTKVDMALSGIVPFILTAARENADSSALSDLTSDYRDDAAFSDPDELLRSADYSDWISENDGLISTVFGSNDSAVLRDIQDKSGLQPESARQITLTAIPAVLGLIGRAFKPEAIPGKGMPDYYV